MKDAWEALTPFIRKSVVVVLGVATVGGLLTGVYQVFGGVATVVLAIACVALIGWFVAIAIARSSTGAESSENPAPEKIEEAIGIPFTSSWLRSTLFDPVARGLFEERCRLLKVSRIGCQMRVRGRDGRLRMTFEGRNESDESVSTFPIILFGGSVVHTARFPENVAEILESGESRTLQQRTASDTGMMSVVDLVFAEPIQPGAEFKIQHTHTYPGSMAEGEDILWYPYHALFARQVEKMEIAVQFDARLGYLHSWVADWSTGSTRHGAGGPVVVTDDDKGCIYKWEIEAPSRDSLYLLTFERDTA